MSDSPEFLKLLTGSFSTPAAGNPTGAIVEAAYTHRNIPARYINCDVASENLRDAVRGAFAMGWIGFNCSLPHKQAVIPFLDELEQSASLIGAVNCVVRRNDRFVGENTDGKGFLASLRTLIDPAGTTITILGSGGAARAIAVELALAGAKEITVVSIQPTAAEDLVRTIASATKTRSRSVNWVERYEVSADTEILVNATSVGMAPKVSEQLNLDVNKIEPHMIVCDVVMNPPITHFLRSAAERGAKTLDGRGMLVNQTALNILHWTGRSVDTDVLRSELDRVLPA